MNGYPFHKKGMSSFPLTHMTHIFQDVFLPPTREITAVESKYGHNMKKTAGLK